jgi:trigger factor
VPQGLRVRVSSCPPKIMKVEVKSKKGLKTSLSIIVEKKTIQEKLDEKLLKLQTEVSLKGFRPGKVPSSVIKSQFGKAIYGEVIDQVLKESSMKALDDKKIKAAGQPKIDLKTFGEGKDLNYILEVESLPEIKIKSFQEIKALEYKVKVDQKSIESKLKEIAEQHKHYEDKEEGEKSELENQITFDYSATVDGNKFEGSEGKAVQIELGKNLFLEGFDKQLVGVKKNDNKIVEVNLPANHPKKELANKRTKFNCKIISVKKAKKNKIDDEFAKHMGAKDLPDLKSHIEKQISSQYAQALNSITKKEILEQIESKHDLEVPKGLVDNELAAMTQTLKKEEIEKHKIKNEKLAISRIKTGLILNEIGEKNHLKVTEQEIKDEINKQIKGMPGQEKMVIDYYQKNPSASQSLKGAIYEEKIINLLKTKIKLNIKEINIDEAERIINNLNKPKENKDNPKSAKSKALKNKKK